MEDSSLLIFKTNIVRSRLDLDLARVLLTVPPVDEEHDKKSYADTD